LRKPRKATAITLGALIALYAIYLGALYLFQSSLIYPGTADQVDAVAPTSSGAELLKIPGESGETEALFLPASPDTESGPRPLLIFAHGNGEVIDYWLTALHGFRERGIGVLLVEYPGYGRSSGSPSEASIRAAMDAAYDRVITDPRVDRGKIVGYGQSLGGGAICALARDRSLGALILQSTFVSLDHFAWTHGAPPFLLRSHFDNLSTVSGFPGPVLVINGSEDHLIPWQQGRRLADAGARASFKLYACGHGCWDPDHLPFWRDADAFLVSAGILRKRFTAVQSQ